MSVRCVLHIHRWNGCRCLDCGKVRDKKHTWDGCTCLICHVTRDSDHMWETRVISRREELDKSAGYGFRRWEVVVLEYTCKKCGKREQHEGDVERD